MTNETTPRPGHPGDRPTNTGATAPPPHRDEDEFDAQEYVKQLIARMGHAIVPTQVAARTEEKAVESAPKKVARVTVPTPPRLPRAVELGQVDEAPDEQRARRMEVPVDIEKLREAVNLSTTSQLNGFDRRTTLKTAYYELFGTVLLMVLSLSLVMFSYQVMGLAHIASLAALVGAASFMFRFSSTTDLLRHHIPSSELPVEELTAV